MILSIVGKPATGKSSLMKKLIERSDDWKVKKYKKLRFTVSRTLKTVVFGIYYNDPTKVFVGTDVLSMDINRDAFSFLRKLLEKNPDYRVLIEGDRFTNLTFFNHLQSKGYKFKILELRVDEKEYKKRQFARNNMQSEQFINRVGTKIENIRANFPVEYAFNNSWEDSTELILKIEKLLNISPAKLRKNESNQS